MRRAERCCPGRSALVRATRIATSSARLARRNTVAMSQRAQDSDPGVRRVSAALIVALISLLIGGWVFIWNGDGGGPFPVALIEPGPASVPYLLTAAALVAHLIRSRSRLARCFVLAAASAAAVATLWFRSSVLGDADSINRSSVPEGEVVGFENALTRAVSGQLTEVDPTVFSVSWAFAAICLFIGAGAAGITLWQDRWRP